MAITTRLITGLLETATGDPIANKTIKLRPLGAYGDDGILVSRKTIRVVTGETGLYSVELTTSDVEGAFSRWECFLPDYALRDTKRFDLFAGEPISLDELFNLYNAADSSNAAALALALEGLGSSPIVDLPSKSPELTDVLSIQSSATTEGTATASLQWFSLDNGGMCSSGDYLAIGDVLIRFDSYDDDFTINQFQAPDDMVVADLVDYINNHPESLCTAVATQVFERPWQYEIDLTALDPGSAGNLITLKWLPYDAYNSNKRFRISRPFSGGSDTVAAGSVSKTTVSEIRSRKVVSGTVVFHQGISSVYLDRDDFGSPVWGEWVSDGVARLFSSPIFEIGSHIKISGYFEEWSGGRDSDARVPLTVFHRLRGASCIEIQSYTANRGQTPDVSLRLVFHFEISVPTLSVNPSTAGLGFIAGTAKLIDEYEGSCLQLNEAYDLEFFGNQVNWWDIPDGQAVSRWYNQIGEDYATCASGLCLHQKSILNN